MCLKIAASLQPDLRGAACSISPNSTLAASNRTSKRHVLLGQAGGGRACDFAELDSAIGEAKNAHVRLLKSLLLGVLTVLCVRRADPRQGCL